MRLSRCTAPLAYDRGRRTRPTLATIRGRAGQTIHGNKRRNYGGFLRRLLRAVSPVVLHRSRRDVVEPVERALSQVRAWVEHPFHVVKNLFRHKKLRYRGLAKNELDPENETVG